MGRDRRCIVSNTCYELCFRAVESLPLSAHDAIQEILKSAAARTQRDNKVTICHDIWNGSHLHLILIAHDAEQCANFYSEIQKKITDAIKRLLGKRRLRLWEGRVTLMELPDLEAAIKRIIYLYSNPAQDDLETSIERFPGLSSWQEFRSCGNKLFARTEETVCWIRLPTIPILSSPYLSAREDRNIRNLLRSRNKKKTHKLYRKPNAWMKCFDVDSEEEVKEINERIVAGVRDSEFQARERRRLEKKTVLGRAALLSQPILKSHEPKKHDRKIFVISTIKELRLEIMKLRKAFVSQCNLCYEKWKAGDFSVEWPPGAFKPPVRPLYNVLPDWPGSNLVVAG